MDFFWSNKKNVVTLHSQMRRMKRCNSLLTFSRALFFTSRGGAVVARWAHNPKVVGSSPAPATKLRTEQKCLVLFFNLAQLWK